MPLGIETLSDKIDKHLSNQYSRFHSPAHCGQLNPRDLTELDALDDLQYPEGVLKDSQDFVAELFNAKRSFFLVNGASAGMQAACIALKLYLNSINDTRPVLVARNVHKSTIAGIILAGLKIEWLEPEWNGELGVYSAIRNDTWQSTKLCDYSSLIMTNPSYEGFYSELNYQASLPVIVDEAHGAHYHFSNQLPKPALDCGADLVIQSWHKTLGSLTQTGVLHLNRNSKIPEKFIEDSLRLLQTTSPSYLLMESITKTAELYSKQGAEIVNRTIKFSKRINIEAYPNNDPYRLMIKGPGLEIERILAENKILIEAATENFVLLFVNPFNTEEDIMRINELSLELTSLVEKYQLIELTKPEIKQAVCLREHFFNEESELKAPCPPGILL